MSTKKEPSTLLRIVLIVLMTHVEIELKLKPLIRATAKITKNCDRNWGEFTRPFTLSKAISTDFGKLKRKVARILDRLSIVVESNLSGQFYDSRRLQ